MKKRNVATAMAAAMAFGGVAPVVANANEPVVRSVVEGNNNASDKEILDSAIDVALANGADLKTTTTYTTVYNTKFTDATKDDVLNDGIGEVLAITDAGVVVERPAKESEFNEKGLTIAYTETIKKPNTTQSTAIAKTKGDLADTKAEIERLLALEVNNDKGEKVKAYTVNEKSTKVVIINGIPVYKVALTKADNTNLKDKYFNFKGVKAEVNAENNTEVFENGTIDLTTTAGTIVDEEVIAKPEQLVALNKCAYGLKIAVKEGKITVTEKQAGSNDLELIVKSTKTEKTLGKVLLKNFKAYKNAGFPGFVDMTTINGLEDLNKPELSWATEYVVDAVAAGHISGDERGLRLEDSITRAEFAKMIVTVGNITTGDTTKEAKFTDVDQNEWYAEYVNQLTDLGVIVGNGDNKFRPNDAITREEAATMIAAVLTDDYSKVDRYENNGSGINSKTKFRDDAKIQLWADGAVKVLNEAGISKGDGHGNFNPQTDITRAETVAMINRMVKAQGTGKVKVESVENGKTVAAEFKKN